MTNKADYKHVFLLYISLSGFWSLLNKFLNAVILNIFKIQENMYVYHIRSYILMFYKIWYIYIYTDRSSDLKIHYWTLWEIFIFFIHKSFVRDPILLSVLLHFTNLRIQQYNEYYSLSIKEPQEIGVSYVMYLLIK